MRWTELLSCNLNKLTVSTQRQKADTVKLICEVCNKHHREPLSLGLSCCHIQTHFSLWLNLDYQSVAAKWGGDAPSMAILIAPLPSPATVAASHATGELHPKHLSPSSAWESAAFFGLLNRKSTKGWTGHTESAKKMRKSAVRSFSAVKLLQSLIWEKQQWTEWLKCYKKDGRTLVTPSFFLTHVFFTCPF